MENAVGRVGRISNYRLARQIFHSLNIGSSVEVDIKVRDALYVYNQRQYRKYKTSLRVYKSTRKDKDTNIFIIKRSS